MPTPASQQVPPLSAIRTPPEQRDPTTVQVLGMDVSRSQSLVRNASNTSDVSVPSGTSTPQMHGDYAVTRSYIPSHGSNASRLHNQSSFSTTASHSPASSEAHEELASLPSRSANHNYDSSTLRLAGAADTASRRSHLTHANRVLSHKDSFGGSYAFNAGAELSFDSADEASASPFLTNSQRLADDPSLEGHHRIISLSRPAQRSHDGARIPMPFDSYHSADGSGVSDLTEPIEILGRPSAFTDLTSAAAAAAGPNTSASRSSTLTTSRSRAALSAAAEAASARADHPADTTFAARFDQSLSLDTVSPTTNAFANADLSVAEQNAFSAPGSSIAKSSASSSSTPLASKANERIDHDTTTPSASSNDLRRSAAPSGKPDPAPARQRKPSAPLPPTASQPKDRRDRDERDKAEAASTKRTAGASRTREPAAPSTSTRTDANSAAPRPLKTSHRTLPQLPSATSVQPAPPPAMYWSKAPVHGSVPRRSFRAHTANLCDEVLWLFGGCDNRGCFRDLWCFDTETMCWSKPKVTGDIPPARRAHSATMVNKRLFVFAGGDGPHYFNDLYIFDTVSLRWSKPEVGGTAPSPRRAHTCNYYEGQLIVFGGGNGVGALNDVHTLDVNDLSRLEWRKLDCSGKVPIGRGYHTSNLVDGKLIVIGGSDGHMSFNDIHILRLDTRTWYQVKTDEIHNRLGHTATQVGSYLFIFGGHDSKTYTSELLTLNLVNLQWEPRKVCGQKPLGRGYHQAWLRDSRLFVHGGFDGKDIFDDLHFLDLAACAYLPQITSFSVELDHEE
ncbi:related to Tip elongation aberrant protein 1 [Sporisorium reilianum SRZ2]|uniref:Related to Tip elongation aberrant protein 1 n=1 Tax=Sporisorium reilianum (strain SRZ2) TaxID=999809 RepID=E7A2H1_SPORE|nr:related to Tip elongation aberrant protein 1 [Sporisorium reilianum SRZ2]